MLLPGLRIAPEFRSLLRLERTNCNSLSEQVFRLLLIIQINGLLLPIQEAPVVLFRPELLPDKLFAGTEVFGPPIAIFLITEQILAPEEAWLTHLTSLPFLQPPLLEESRPKHLTLRESGDISQTRQQGESDWLWAPATSASEQETPARNLLFLIHPAMEARF